MINYGRQLAYVATMVSGLLLAGPSWADQYEITFSGTINSNSINPPVANSFYGGQPFSGTIYFDSSSPTTVAYGVDYYTAGQSLSLLVGPINQSTTPFTIFRTIDDPSSQENYYYFDSGQIGAGTTGNISASGYTLQRDIVLYQVPYTVDPSFSTNLLTTQSEINALFPYWTLAMFFSNGSDSQSVYGTVTTMSISPVPLPLPAGLLALGLASFVLLGTRMRLLDA